MKFDPSRFWLARPSSISKLDWCFHPANDQAFGAWVRSLLDLLRDLSKLTGETFARQSWIARRLQKGRRWICETLKRLEQIGLISKRSTGINRYRVNALPDAEPPEQSSAHHSETTEPTNKTEKEPRSKYSLKICADFADWLQRTQGGLRDVRAFGLWLWKSGHQDRLILKWGKARAELMVGS